MKKSVKVILIVLISVVCVYGIKQASSYFASSKHESEMKTDELFQKIAEADKKCDDQLYGILLGMRYSYPEVYEVLTEMARVKNIQSCDEYVQFLESRIGGIQKK